MEAERRAQPNSALLPPALFHSTMISGRNNSFVLSFSVIQTTFNHSRLINRHPLFLLRGCCCYGCRCMPSFVGLHVGCRGHAILASRSSAPLMHTAHRYLLLMTAENEGQGNPDVRDVALLTDEQLKYLVIFGGVAALVLLVMLQAACMIWRDKKKSKNLNNKVSTCLSLSPDPSVPASRGQESGSLAARPTRASLSDTCTCVVVSGLRGSLAVNLSVMQTA